MQTLSESNQQSRPSEGVKKYIDRRTGRVVTMLPERQAVKRKCSVPFLLEGREVDVAHNGSSPPPGGLTAQERCVRDGHEWRWCEGAECANEGSECCKLSRLVCLRCQESFWKKCGAARPSKCIYCAELHRGDVAAVGRSGWVDNTSDRGYWCALTAPGEPELPFDRTLCTHTPGLKCSGTIGCVAEATALAIWHDGMAARWSHFVTSLRRLLNKGMTGAPSTWPVRVQFFKTYEPQKRQALHAHFMVRVSGVVTDSRFRAAYRLAARRNGFGPQSHCEHIDLSDEEAVAKKAGYCAKYSTKCAEFLPDLVRLDPMTGEVRRGGLRSWSASREWGDTMKLVRAKRREYWATVDAEAAAACLRVPGAAGALDSYGDFYATGQPEGQLCDGWGTMIAG